MLRSRGELLLFADADGATTFSEYSKLEASIRNLCRGTYWYLVFINMLQVLVITSYYLYSSAALSTSRGTGKGLSCFSSLESQLSVGCQVCFWLKMSEMKLDLFLFVVPPHLMPMENIGHCDHAWLPVAFLAQQYKLCYKHFFQLSSLLHVAGKWVGTRDKSSKIKGITVL